MYITWHENTTGGICSNIWTPFSDQQTEGLFLNMNNNAVAELQVWDKAQPNGERDENFVVINIPRAALIDVARNPLVAALAFFQAPCFYSLMDFAKAP